MKAFTQLRATAAALIDQGKLMANVDTDMIIPKQFLKTTEREGLSEGLFYDLKTRADGSPDPDFEPGLQTPTSSRVPPQGGGRRATRARSRPSPAGITTCASIK